MTNYEYLQSKAGIVDVLDKIDNGCFFAEEFGKVFCDKCDSVKCYVPAFERECDCAYCEVNEGKCRFFDHYLDNKEIIMWWLDQEMNVKENS